MPDALPESRPLLASVGTRSGAIMEMNELPLSGMIPWQLNGRLEGGSYLVGSAAIEWRTAAQCAIEVT